MDWEIQNMVDPGDGLVSTTLVKHESDDICQVAADAYNGSILDHAGERIVFYGWIMSIKALPSDD